MKVILLKDVPKVGRSNETHIVSDGYARNYLIPNGLAEIATAASIARIKLAASLNRERALLEETKMTAALTALNGNTVTIQEKVNEKGHLFHGIHEADLVATLEAQHGVTLSADMMEGAFPIKDIGDHEVALVHGADKATITVTISPSEPLK